MPGAKEAALKAIALDETVAEAHTALAAVHHMYEWNWVEVEREYLRARELNPGDAQARGYYATLLALEGRAAEAVADVALDRVVLTSELMLGLVPSPTPLFRYDWPVLPDHSWI